jgi:hypothetical protein
MPLGQGALILNIILLISERINHGLRGLAKKKLSSKQKCEDVPFFEQCLQNVRIRSK